MAKSKMVAALGDAKIRTFVIIGGVFIVGIVIYALTQIGGGDITTGDASRTAGVPSAVKGIPGQATPEKYAQLLRQENLSIAEQAEKTGGAAIPTIVGQTSDQAGFGADGGAFGPGGFGPNGGAYGRGGAGGVGGGTAGQFGAGGEGDFGGAGAGGSGFGAFGQAGNQRAGGRNADELRAERLRQQREDLERRRAERERQKELDRLRKLAEAERNRYQQDLQQRAATMAQYAQALGNVWSKVTPQVYVLGVLATKGDDGDTSDKSDSKEGQVVTNPDGTIVKDQDGIPVINKKQKEIIKAGTILFAVLDTAINSDEPSPVLATVVHGKYKGARMIGTIERPENGEKVIVTFRTMNIPGRDKSNSVNAVAIDPDTARTALASDVDHHYLLRYGSLFASAFMQGYGQAVSQQGTVTTSPNGTTQETKPSLSGSEQFYAALGKVGEEWGNAVRPLFDTPVTVTVNQGIGLGLLFMSDVDITPTEG